MGEILLSRQETAEYLKVSLTTLNNWRKSGTLTPVGIGKRVLYRMSDIQECLVELN